MESRDPIMERISAAVALLERGEGEAARADLARIWAELGPGSDPFHRCTLAHFMADLQADPEEELAWDRRALEAADELNDERVKQHHASLTLRGFYPSLHLNLAEDYRKLGNLAQARMHLDRAKEALESLPEDGYGQLIRMGIARLGDRLGTDG